MTALPMSPTVWSPLGSEDSIKQQQLIDARFHFCQGYMSAMGWGTSFEELSLKQIEEIRHQEGWKYSNLSELQNEQNHINNLEELIEELENISKSTGKDLDQMFLSIYNEKRKKNESDDDFSDRVYKKHLIL